MINRQSAKLLVLLSTCIAYSSLISVVINSLDSVGGNSNSILRWPIFVLGMLTLVSLRLRLQQRGVLVAAAIAIGVASVGWLWLRTGRNAQELVVSGFGVGFLMSRAIQADQWNHDWLQQLFWRGLGVLVAFGALGPAMSRGALEQPAMIQLFMLQALLFMAASLFAMMLDQSNQAELQTPPMLGWSSLFTLILIAIPLLLFGVADGQRSILALIISSIMEGVVLIVGGIGVGLTWSVGQIIPSFQPDGAAPIEPRMPESLDPSSLPPEETNQVSSMLGNLLNIAVTIIIGLMLAWLVYRLIRWIRDLETKSLSQGDVVIEQSIWSFQSLREQFLERFRGKRPWKTGGDDPQVQKVRRIYTKFLELGEDHGQPRSKHQTANEYGQGYGQRQPTSQPAIDELTAIYTQARYANQLDAEAVQHAEQALKTIQKQQP